MIVLKSSKAQIQMMETLMVAIVFMVVLIIALAFYFKFSLESVEEEGEQACLVSNTVLLSSVTSMPEIQCSVSGKTEHCVDTTKLLLFDPTREYGDLFSTNCKQKITFTQLYPEVDAVECTQNLYPNCGTFVFYDPGVAYDASIAISTPITLYNPLEDSYVFGKLTIEVLQ